MRIASPCGVLLLALTLLACAPRVVVQEREEGRFGRIRLFASHAAGDGLVFVFSDAGGWNAALSAAAEEVARDGAVVVGVDLPTYLAHLRASDDGCHYVVAEIEDLSHRVQREHRFPVYRAPILAGLGAGGTLAQAALSQSPSATLDGAIGVDPAASLATRVPLCAGAPATPEDGAYRYGAAPALPGFWWVSPRAALAPELAPLAQAPPGVEDTGAREARLAASIDARLAQERATRPDPAAVPLVEIPAAGGSPTQLAVIYSGDGGWRDLDKQIAGVLAREGTPVVGVDSLRYFWREKSPETVAADLAAILMRYRARWHAERVLLIGYSFGAGILPFAVAGLPPALRDAVLQVSLLGLEPRAAFQFSVAGWLGLGAEGRPVLPVLRTLDLRRVQCFYGEEEEQTLCTAPELAGAERIRTAGGHHFDGDYERLARQILNGAARRAAATPPSTPPGAR